MMKSMTDCINCDDAKVASAAFVCVLSCRFASNGRASVPASRNGRASVLASRNEGRVYERA